MVVVAVFLGFAASASADPPDKLLARGFTEGANHHLGDAGFRAIEGRDYRTSDGEFARIHDHFVYVRELLASRPAPRPELEPRRAELLSYFDEYIHAGTTPKNTYVPWRTPVFIDAKGQICAVGYLIERTAGRPAAEKIAASHRLSFIEDIAAAEPEVRDWVASSGFTLDELTLIQPGYEGPDIGFEAGWDEETPHDDGRYESPDGGVVTRGEFTHGKMAGAWTTADAEGHATGTGTFTAGNGMWHSTYANGTKLAEGHFVANHPSGEWTFFHPNGKRAAQGRLDKGHRTGEWTFWADDGATVVSRGTFDKTGLTGGTWRHYDPTGKLLATAKQAGEGLDIKITPDKSGIAHEVMDGIPAETWRVDLWSRGNAKLYLDWHDRMWDADGHLLAHAGGAWTQADCHWAKKRKRAARAGNIPGALAEAGVDENETDPSCAEAKPVPAAKAKQLDELDAARREVRSPTPAFIRAFPPNGMQREGANEDDLASILTHNISWYMEWPFVDGLFSTVFQTLPGYGLRSQ